MTKKSIEYKYVFMILAVTFITTLLIFTDAMRIKEREIKDLIEKYDNMILEYENKIELMDEYILETNKVILILENEIEETNDKLNKANSKIKSLENKTMSGNTMTFEATAYSGDTITATGTVPKVGRTIAVDPKVIPYGSQVYIEGMGTYIAEDCGGAVKGNIIDIFMSSKEECREWGRRKVQIKIL